MTRVGVFLTAILAAASLGLFAQDHSTSAASPSAASSSTAVTQTSTQNSTSNPAAQQGTPSSSAPSAPAARDSSSAPTTASPNRTIEGSTSNDPATSNGQLPQTSTILPLLGLIGLGSLVAGLFARR
jgi:hypothetical protein